MSAIAAYDDLADARASKTNVPGTRQNTPPYPHRRPSMQPIFQSIKQYGIHLHLSCALLSACLTLAALAAPMTAHSADTKSKPARQGTEHPVKRKVPPRSNTSAVRRRNQRLNATDASPASAAVRPTRERAWGMRASNVRRTLTKN